MGVRIADSDTRASDVIQPGPERIDGFWLSIGGGITVRSAREWRRGIRSSRPQALDAFLGPSTSLTPPGNHPGYLGRAHIEQAKGAQRTVVQ
jgi:hypothetical protein